MKQEYSVISNIRHEVVESFSVEAAIMEFEKKFIVSEDEKIIGVYLKFGLKDIIKKTLTTDGNIGC